MEESRTLKKQELVEKLLEHGMVMVTLDARRPGVDVPKHLRENPQLRLNLSYRFGMALDVSPWGIHSTLTFGGIPHDCKIPWSAIFQILSHATSEQFLFPRDIPDELGVPGVAAEREEERAPVRKPGVRLALVSDRSEIDGEVPAPSPAPGDEGGGPRRGHLRRIK